MNENAAIIRAKLRDPFPATSNARLDDLQSTIGCTLPDDYRHFLLTTNGGVFHDYVSAPGGSGVSVVFGMDAGHDWADLTRQVILTEGWVDHEQFLPVASDGGGGLYFLKLTEPHLGMIYFADSSVDSPELIADSISEFLSHVQLDLVDVEHVPDPAVRAVQMDDFKRVRQLLDDGLSVNHRDEKRKTLLMHAIWRCRLEIAAMLIDRNADVNARDYRSETPLFYAVAAHSPSCVDLLLSHGADLNDVNDFGESVLMSAAGAASVRCVEVLLRRGADASYRSPKGLRAIDYCSDPEVRELIQRH